MKMTFNDYIVNPMGRANSVFSHREMYRKMYSEKLDKILLREVGKVKYDLYYDKRKDEYFVHMKIPSEVVENFYYDTIVKFYTEDSTVYSSRTVKDYHVKFYSNDPSFVYTFAHAFITNELFITELTPKMSKLAVKKVAVEKNPGEEVGYVKSLFFLYLLMAKYDLWDKIKYESYGEKLNIKKLLSDIEDADKKIEDRKIKGQEQDKKNRKEKKSNPLSTSRPIQPNAVTPVQTTQQRVQNTKTVKKANTAKKSKRI